MASSVIHVIPAGVFANTYQGSYKDTISRVRFFESRNADYRRVVLEDDDPRPVLGAARQAAAPRFLFEYTSFRHALHGVRSQFPQSFLAVRAHNIEPLQHWDNHGWRTRAFSPRFLRGVARLAWTDVQCKRAASAIYSISDWENRVYWSRLPGRAAVEWLPYYCPEHLLPQSTESPERLPRIVCLPTSQKNRKSWDLATRFLRLAELLERDAPGEFQFVMTGDLESWGLPESPAVQRVGLVDDVRELMLTSAAVCLLSPLGYGFKTTMGDAIAHGCRVLVHPWLARRSPADLREAMCPFDTDRPDEMRSLIEFLRTPLDVSGLDSRMRRINEAILARDFQIEPVEDAAPAGAAREALNGS